jgi:hypothetical protein
MPEMSLLASTAAPGFAGERTLPRLAWLGIAWLAI